MSRTAPSYIDDTYKQLAEHVHKKECSHCGSRDNLVVHHIDGNRKNSTIENMIILCRDCHQSVHGYKSELPLYLELLRLGVDKDSMFYGNVENNNISQNYETVKIDKIVWEQVQDVMDEQEYGSADGALRHMAREGGYDV